MLISMLLLFSTSKFHFQAKKTSMYSITKFQVRFRFIINMLFILHSNANLLTSMNQYAPQWTYSKCTNAWVLIRRIFSAYLFDLGAIPQPITRAILLLLLHALWADILPSPKVTLILLATGGVAFILVWPAGISRSNSYHTTARHTENSLWVACSKT